MLAIFYFEAGQPSGKSYRLSLGVFIPWGASIMALFTRLF
jgi:hypothetical protein